jgi:L-ornithine N5-oxygenase
MKHSLDILGVGLGPTNLALATAIEEQKINNNQLNNCLFFDKKTEFNWHPGMLLPGSKLQVPFIRDLATLRNPQSPFTFLNYLKVKQRLDHFINLRTFYPSRAEFYDYLNWACQQLNHLIRFNCEVKAISSIRNEKENSVSALKITYFNKISQQAEEIVANNIVLGMGKQIFVPTCAAISDSRVIHTEDFLYQVPSQFQDLNKNYHFVVVGSGQSAGEVVFYLLNHYPNSYVHWCFRSFALKGIDNSPFVNQQYHEVAIDDFYQLSDTARTQTLIDLKQSNYSVVDSDVLTALTQLNYENRLENKEHLLLHNGMQLKAVTPHMNHLEAVFDNLLHHDSKSIKADGIILATGYTQAQSLKLLSDVGEFLIKDQRNRYKITRDYRLQTQPQFTAGIYLQGYCEDSHGPSDATLAVLATRAEQIVNSILKHQVETAKKDLYAIREN